MKKRGVIKPEFEEIEKEEAKENATIFNETQQENFSPNSTLETFPTEESKEIEKSDSQTKD